MKAYFGSRFSPNMTKTPEGYLICHNVPISRTGDYEYLGQELGLDECRDQVVKVYRSPEEVFSSASIASFEGKPVTDEHPSTDVRPDNYTSFMKGIVTNVRKGTGEDSDCVVADLVIYDPKLQSEIETGKREVSCGYDCLYEGTEDGQYRQRQIFGNHVAVVSKGRAGNRVAIKDSDTITDPNLEKERSMDMAKKKEINIFTKMLLAFAKDADPAELEEAIDAVSGKDEEEVKPPKVDLEEQKSTDGAEEDILGRLANIEAVLAKLVKTDEEVHTEVETDELGELEKELSEDEELEGEKAKEEVGEESVTVSPEEITEESVEAAKEEKEEEKEMTADSREALLNTVKAMKPFVASIKDPMERKKATDALVKTVRGQMANKSTKAEYANLNKPTQNKATDSAATDKAEFGQKCAARNPHSKGGK